eukprot:Gb_07638 [translate_table: standard]
MVVMSTMALVRLSNMPLFIKSIKMSAKVTFSPFTATTETTLEGELAGKFNADINKLCREGRLKDALGLLDVMNRRRIGLDSDAYAALLQVCTNMKAFAEGKQVHTHMLSSGVELNIFLSTKLVSMYVMCNSLVNARLVFDNISMRNVFCWNAMIRGYIKSNLWEETLTLYYQMLKDGIQPDRFTFPYVLKACAGLSALQEGEKIHDFIISTGLESDIFVSSALIDMYAKCGNMEFARQVFDRMPERDIVSWSAMIGGYAQNEPCDEALKFFRQMLLSGVKPDPVIIASVLPACARLAALQQGKEIHDYIIRSGFESDIFVQNALIDIYTKCGSTEDAHHVFDNMPERDVVSWSSMIAGHSQNGHCDQTLKLFRQMKLAGVKPSSVTFASVLPACAHLAFVKQGKEIHNYIIRSGLESDIFVGSALIDMYAKCGSIGVARQVFNRLPHRDVVLWNAIIAGYAQNGLCDEALDLSRQIQRVSVKPNSVTMVSILPACARLASLQQGQEIHAYSIRNGFESDDVVGSALIDMYAKCGSIDVARLVFDRMFCTDVVLWNAMISGYAQSGHCNEALKLFHQIQQTGVKPDSVTLTSILPACARLANLQQGKEIHDYIVRNEFESDVSVGNVLIDMYAKCGIIEIGRRVFDKMSDKDVISWNSMIAGYGMHGHGVDALRLFYQMQKEGMTPDYITFIALLSTCSHVGLVDKGWQYFDSMSRDYQIVPRMEHYACMVDLLGRAGHLDEAWDFIKKMPSKPSADVWGSLLGACRVYCNIELAECVAARLFELKPDNAGYYVLLSNIYAAAGRWVDVTNVRTLMKERGLKKKPGCSWIEVGNRVHSFVVGDRSHPQSEKIYAALESLARQMKEAGYVPDTSFVLHDAEDDSPI